LAITSALFILFNVVCTSSIPEAIQKGGGIWGSVKSLVSRFFGGVPMDAKRPPSSLKKNLVYPLKKFGIFLFKKPLKILISKTLKTKL